MRKSVNYLSTKISPGPPSFLCFGRMPKRSCRPRITYIMKMKGSNCLKDHSLPLDIVLGSLANEPLSSTQVESDATTTYILGTSYFATPRLGAALKLNKDGRVPMSDRKGAFDHYRPKALMLSVSSEGWYLFVAEEFISHA